MVSHIAQFLYNKKLIVLVLLLAMVAIFIAMASLVRVASVDSKPFGADEVVTNDSDVYEVLYTETGFTPSRLEVPLGASVTFKNITETDLWVGSDPHPEHTDHAEFDALKAYGKGTAYTFEFNRSGTFGYHNHKKSVHRGVIVVVDYGVTEREINKTPKGLEGVRDTFIKMFEPNDPNSIFTIIDSIQSDPELSLNCHDIAHDLGHRAYELYGFSEAMTFNNPNHVNHPLVQYICAGGYMHGILEALSLHQPDFLADPDQICEGFSVAERDSCFHGVGHVFMLANERNTDASLNNCRLIENSTDMYRCFEGIRMEQFWGNTAHVGSDTLGWDVENPLATCIDAKTDEKPTCFLYAPFGYLREHPKDYFGAVNFCTQDTLSTSDSTFCLKGLGITMMSKFKGKNLENSELYVTGLQPSLRYAFYEGVLGYAQLSGVSENVLKTTCERFKTDSQLCLDVHSSMKPTFEAYDMSIASLKNSQSVKLASEFFVLANKRDLSKIESLLSETTTYSPHDEGVYFGKKQIMEALRIFYGEYRSLNWDITKSKEIRPGVVQFEYIFSGTSAEGKETSLNGTAYIIVNNETIQHIESRLH